MEIKHIFVSEDDTLDFARRFGSLLKGGEIIQLIGDVGAGKTTFVRGLMKGLESSDPVSSPTFTICNRYEGGRLPVAHCDFYRLHDDALIEKEIEEMISGKTVLILEWSENLKSIKDKATIDVHITSNVDGSRSFRFSFPNNYNYLSI